MNSQNIIKLYESGLSIKKISKKFGISREQIKSQLIQNKIIIRKSCRQIAINYHEPLSELNENVAELWGLHAGDGSLTKNEWEFSSNINDRVLNNHVIYLVRKVVGVEPRITHRPSLGKTEISSGQKQTLNYFSKNFPIGKKSHFIKMPKEIMKSNNQKIIKAALIGLFSSDGSFSFRKRKKNTLTPRLEFRVKSERLRNQFIELASKTNVGFCVSNPKHRNGFIFTAYTEKISTVLKWMKEIGSNCDSHNEKFNEWLGLKYAGVA